jgi:hypothetical protein
MKRRVLIMGAAGRDFHNFNTFFRGNDDYEVVAFTATQIPDIEGRKYPAELAGENYPEGIPIFPEDNLDEKIDYFSADWETIQKDVKDSIDFSNHGCIRNIFDKLVLAKPSVSFVMTLLSVLFVLFWATLIIISRCL